MAAIGTETVAAMRGTLSPMRERVQEITRANVDGVAARLIGKYAEPMRIETIVDVASAAAAASKVATYRGMVGTLVSVTESNGNVKNNVLIRDVQTQIRPCVNVAGGLAESPTHVVVANWLLQTTEVT